MECIFTIYNCFVWITNHAMQAILHRARYLYEVTVINHLQLLYTELQYVDASVS